MSHLRISLKRVSLVAVALSAAALVAVGCNTSKTYEANVSTPSAKVADAGPSAAFGEPIKLGAAEPVTVQQLLGNISAYEGKPVLVSGDVNEVCERKGCWMTMTDGKEKLFVKFTCPIEGRLIPMEAKGKKAMAQGELQIKEISEDDARHMAEEGGKTPEEVAKIVGPQKQVTLQSPGAVVYGVTLK